MKRTPHVAVGRLMLSCLSLSLLTMAGRAATPEEAGRSIYEKNKAAVVTVEVVIKSSFSMPGMGSQSDESKSECVGTVIQPDGLTVVALSSADPSSLYSAMMGGMAGMGMEGMDMQSEITDCKIILEDKSEVPAQLILRDKDLDIAFVRPREKPASDWVALDLKQAADPALLETLVTVNRLGKNANRAHSVNLDRVTAIVERPRKFYVPGMVESLMGQGCPAFALDGKVVGVLVMRMMQSGSGGGMNPFAMDDMMMPILLPAADVLSSAQQAPPFGSAGE